MPARKEILEVAGREVTVTNPDKVFFPTTGHTKLDLVRYYLAVADGALRGVAGRPMALKRFVNGAEGEFFFQKRAPSSRPDWIETVELSFPSGRTAEEIVVRDAAQLVWIVNLGCIDLNPHPVRADDLDHPDELRVDLDPVPGIEWPQIRDVAMVTQEVLEDVRPRRVAEDLGLARDPRLRADRTPVDVPRGPTRGARARAGGRTARPGPRHQPVVEGGAPRRVPRLQPEREGPNRRLRVLGPPDARRARLDAARVGRGSRVRAGRVHDRHGAGAVRRASATRPRASTRRRGRSSRSSSSPAQHEAAGFGDAPWPPQYAKQEGEPARVQPSKRRRGTPQKEGVVPPPAPGKKTGPTGRRRTKAPLIEIARAETEAEAMQGFERWKARHPTVGRASNPPT